MALKVIIVGAGIAGLCAAIALRRAGLDVEIFEKSAFATEVGAALAITPNGARVLASLGFSFDRARACRIQTWDSLVGPNLSRVGSIDLSAAAKTFGASVWSCHRVDLHSELLRLATTADGGPGRPASLRLSAHVVDADVAGSVTLQDGSRYFADLVVAADGLHSALRAKVVSDSRKAPAKSGMSAFRFLIDTKTLLGDPALAATLDKKGPDHAAILIDPAEKILERHIMWYPCRGGEVQNFVGIHPTQQGYVPDDDEGGMKDLMLQEFRHYHPGVVSIIRKSSHVKRWPLHIHDPLDKWCKGRIVLIGDAAHPMLPFGGQGSNQAMEDAAALGRMLTGIGDRADKIEKRLELFEAVRVKRAARVQTLSKARVGREREVEEELRVYAEPAGARVPTNPPERTFHDYSFNVSDKCDEVLRQTETKPKRRGFQIHG